MAISTTSNQDYLAARLHARRSRMAEGNRLAELCNLRTISELGLEILNTDIHSCVQFQRQLTRELVQELAGCARHVGGAGGDVFAWMLVRFQIENIKTLLRGFVNHVPSDVLQEYLVPFPDGLGLDLPGLASAASVTDLIELLPSGTLRKRLSDAAAAYHDHTRPFFLEVALDGGYFEILLAKTRQLSGEELVESRPVMLQEANLFQLMLAVRGRFLYGLPSDVLSAARLRGVFEDWFKTLLAAPDLPAAAKCSLGIVLDELPGELAFSETDLEALGWKRFLRLASHTFRSGHMGLGVAIGYAGLRRGEVANLITLSEGIRAGMPVEAVRARMIPRPEVEVEVAHV